MTAGASAQYEAERSRLEADEYARLHRQAIDKASRYEIASRSEAEVGGRLSALETLGWRVLADRRWAGSKRANVDFLLVGPGGVVVVDVKAWRALEVRDGSVFCEDDCRDDEVSKLLSLADHVQDSVSLLGLVPQALTPVLVFASRRLDENLGRVALVGERNVASWVTRRGRRLTSEQIDDIVLLLDQDFPPYGRPEPKPVRVPKVRLVMPARRKHQPDRFALRRRRADRLPAAGGTGRAYRVVDDLLAPRAAQAGQQQLERAGPRARSRRYRQDRRGASPRDVPRRTQPQESSVRQLRQNAAGGAGVVVRTDVAHCSGEHSLHRPAPTRGGHPRQRRHHFTHQRGPDQHRVQRCVGSRRQGQSCSPGWTSGRRTGRRRSTTSSKAAASPTSTSTSTCRASVVGHRCDSSIDR